MARENVEYEFDLPDGSHRYEIVCADVGCSLMMQLSMFMKMHGSRACRPVK